MDATNERETEREREREREWKSKMMTSYHHIKHDTSVGAAAAGGAVAGARRSGRRSYPHKLWFNKYCYYYSFFVTCLSLWVVCCTHLFGGRGQQQYHGIITATAFYIPTTTTTTTILTTRRRLTARSSHTILSLLARTSPSQTTTTTSLKGLQRPVEKLDIKTGEVLGTFPSVAKASLSSPGLNQICISLVCKGKRMQHGDYFWRYVGSDSLPVPSVQVPVEQVDPFTGKVLKTYPSVKDAGEHFIGKTAPNHNIKRVCEGKASSFANYFWRYQGSDASPPENMIINKEIEQICVDTGMVLKTFPTGVSVAGLLGRSRQYISLVLNNEYGGGIIDGHFWRYKGTSAMPPHPKPTTTIEKICPTTAEVLETYNSFEAAAKSVSRHPHSIKLAVADKTKQCGGYHWRIKGEAFVAKLDNKRSTKKVRVEKLSLETGEVLETFGSMNAAAKDAGCSNFAMHRAIGLGGAALKGYFWRSCDSNQTPDLEKLNYRPSKTGDHVKPRPIEKVCIHTGKVEQIYDSVIDAVSQEEGIYRSGIYNVLTGKFRTCGGYFWRFLGSNKPVPKGRNQAILGKPVEQVSLTTLEVVNVFPSWTDACDATGTKYNGMRQVLIGKQKYSNGWYWRFSGSSKLPSLPTTTQPVVPIEQVDFNTGEVVRTYNSIKEASIAENIQPEMIKRVLNGYQKSTNYGRWFWREKGSKNSPTPFAPYLGRQKISPGPIEQVDFKTGELVRTYDSIEEASLAENTTKPLISGVLRGRQKSTHYGRWFWREKGSNKSPTPYLPPSRKGRKNTKEEEEVSKGRVTKETPTPKKRKQKRDSGKKKTTKQKDDDEEEEEVSRLLTSTTAKKEKKSSHPQKKTSTKNRRRINK